MPETLPDIHKVAWFVNKRKWFVNLGRKSVMSLHGKQIKDDRRDLEKKGMGALRLKFDEIKARLYSRKYS